ncbi:MAG: outer membrane protein assembly factor BamB family protein [Pirellulales bacterium]
MKTQRFAHWLLLSSVLSLLVIMTPASAQSWLQFRGPNGDGTAAAKNLPTTWAEDQGIAWKTNIQGTGWSSPVIQDGKIWLTSAELEAFSEEEYEKKAAELDPKHRDQLALTKASTFYATEIDYATGKVLKKIDLFYAENPDPIHATNSYASPTPVLEGNRLYCHFGTYGTCCVNTDNGEIIWKHQIPLTHSVGPGSSPVLVENLLVLTCDGTESQSIVALNKSNGTQAWRTDRPPIRNEDGQHRKAFSTPLLISHQGETQLVISGSQWFCSYNPKTGEELWRVDHGRGFSTVPAPAYKDGVVYLCTGFSSSELWSIRVDGSGDVTDSHMNWMMKKQVPNKPSPVIVGNELYMISEKGIATCVDIKTGDIHWAERMSGNYSASPVFADGKVYFCSEEGKTTVIKPSTEYDELATNMLDGQIMATPVVLDNNILLRSDKALYRVQK